MTIESNHEKGGKENFLRIKKWWLSISAFLSFFEQLFVEKWKRDFSSFSDSDLNKQNFQSFLYCVRNPPFSSVLFIYLGSFELHGLQQSLYHDGAMIISRSLKFFGSIHILRNIKGGEGFRSFVPSIFQWNLFGFELQNWSGEG